MTDDRTTRPAPVDDFTIGDWLVEPSLDRVSRGDSVLHLRPQLTDLLVVLAQSAGRTVAKHDILDAVWGSRYVGESALTRCIAEIRQAFGDSARQPAILETIPKRGYRLIAPVVFFPPGTPRPSGGSGAALSECPPDHPPDADRPPATVPVPAERDPAVGAPDVTPAAPARPANATHRLRDLPWKVLLALALAAALTLASGRCNAPPVETQRDVPRRSRPVSVVNEHGSPCVPTRDGGSSEEVRRNRAAT